MNQPQDATGPPPGRLEDVRVVTLPGVGVDRNCLSHWYPVLAAAGVPTPRTEIVLTEPDAPGSALLGLLDGAVPDGFAGFLHRLSGAFVRVCGAGPGFLRTGHTSGKHHWRRTCYVPRHEALSRRVAGLVEYSAGADPFGLPTGVWAVRELLPVDPLCNLAKYDGFPLVPEVRAFARGGRVECVHSYWPGAAIRQGMDAEQCRVLDGPETLLGLDALTAMAGSVAAEDVLAVAGVAQAVALAFAADDARDGRGWSVDLIDTRRGWVVTDMAEAARSYHDPACHLELARKAAST